MTLDASTAAALEQRLAVEQSTHRLPSVVAGIVRSGALVWSGAAGTTDARVDGPVPTADTQYRIGSISKTFVAVEVMRLRDAGLLDLADTIGAHLPEVPFGHVTIAQLLTHTSGMQAETNGDWWERTEGGDWASLLASGIGLRFTPGTAFHYSNVGYGVLGELVSRLRGVPWQDAVRTGILEPLGMSRTTTRPQAPSAPGLAVHPLADLVHVEPEHDAVSMAPAGQLWSTVQDLSRWAAFLGGRTGDVLAPETLTEMLHPVAVNDVPGTPWVGAHALGWQMWNVAGRRLAGHGGSMPGFLANLRIDLTSGDGVVLMANATSGLGTAAADLLTLFREREPDAPTPWHADSAQADTLDLVGPWFWGTYAFTLALEADGGLRLGEPGQGRGARFRREGDGWIGLEGYYRGEPLAVERDASGRPLRLVLASFVFTRTPYAPDADVPGGLDSSGWH
ncbi:serine hydrolase domain-containing protein [Aeromicrobium wangtongii]|uniref:Beta-lactamase family protein n=1 Tax=Aeromicrobium wangtongii TaxID=2969247 RepID=A0ABY5MA31_9ACTN|nr:serine hydrolase domain-containing protein [Aeromicrobium wangtongii]MCD9197498.1 beta-lactamase family protein [Aeromicrobium wangtongii]UUP14990.1 beta-lactamase family protein [Aeromicrobium wangtongii]